MEHQSIALSSSLLITLMYSSGQNRKPTLVESFVIRTRAWSFCILHIRTYSRLHNSTFSKSKWWYTTHHLDSSSTWVSLGTNHSFKKLSLNMLQFIHVLSFIQAHTGKPYSICGQTIVLYRVNPVRTRDVSGYFESRDLNHQSQVPTGTRKGRNRRTYGE